MGTRGRMRQRKLPKKLKAIREALGYSQNEVIAALGLEGLRQSNISGYELGRIEPPISVLLAYCEAVNICADVLLDDRYELPKDLPRKKTFHPH